MMRVLPNIISAVELSPSRTLFTRFIPPASPDEALGRWRKYYQAWEAATLRKLPPSQIELIDELQKFLPPAAQLDKSRYSAFAGSSLHNQLRAKNVGTIIVSGVETDVCVLSTVLSAVDIGYRVVVLQDALCSSSDEGHDALMNIYRKRYSCQIEVIDYRKLTDLWLED